MTAFGRLGLAQALIVLRRTAQALMYLDDGFVGPCQPSMMPSGRMLLSRSARPIAGSRTCCKEVAMRAVIARAGAAARRLDLRPIAAARGAVLGALR